MMVKICGITNSGDALAAAEEGASAIGFNFYEGSPRYITPTAARAIGARMPANVLKVGVFVDEGEDTIGRCVEEAGLDIVQLHGNEPPSACSTGRRVWKAFRVTDSWNASLVRSYVVDAILLDGPAPGTGSSWDWRRAEALRSRIILAGGLNAGNVGEAIRALCPWGVDACSRIESAPGIKDRHEMRRFIRAALQSASKSERIASGNSL